MANICKRKWTTRRGEAREAWYIDYRDKDRIKRRHTEKTKRAVEDWLAEKRKQAAASNIQVRVTAMAGNGSASDGAKRTQFGARIRQALRDKLEAAARENGRSISEEAEFRLEVSFLIERFLADPAACRDAVAAISGAQWMSPIA